MQKKLKDYLHFYIGQEIKFKEISGFLLSGKKRKLTPNLYAEIYMQSAWDKICLLLKPIEKEDTAYSPEKLTQLLKSGFDVFGLIKLGLAIELK